AYRPARRCRASASHDLAYGRGRSGSNHQVRRVVVSEHPFEYVAPDTLEEALALLRAHGAEAKVLAGGQSLVPLLNYRLARPRLVMDITGLPLAQVRAEDGWLRVGGLARHHELEELTEIARACPLLPEVARLIGNVRVRSLGTVGGSLAHADPAAELPLAMVALDARLAFAGVADRPLRATAAEDALRGQEPSADRLARAAELARDGLDPQSDAFVSGAYRRLLAGALARRALGRAVSSEGGSAPLPKPPPGMAAAKPPLEAATPPEAWPQRETPGRRVVINGRAREADVRPGEALLELLRNTLGIFDVKEGCG